VLFLLLGATVSVLATSCNGVCATVSALVICKVSFLEIGCHLTTIVILDIIAIIQKEANG